MALPALAPRPLPVRCHGWPQWHCPYLVVRFLCGGYNSSVGFVVPLPVHVANPNGHVDSVGSFRRSIRSGFNRLISSMSRPSAVVAGLFFLLLVAPVVLTLSVVEAMPL
jgi:hypothetical protein